MKPFFYFSVLLMTGGCSVDNGNSSAPDAKITSLEGSWKEWKKLKDKNTHYSYETRSYDELNGFDNLRAKRTIIDFDIVKNTVSCRGYSEVIMEPGESPRTVDSWTEIVDINAHSSGFKAQPIDTIYQNCRQKLDTDLKNTELRFFPDTKLLMQCINTSNEEDQIDVHIEKISFGEQRCLDSQKNN